MPVRPDTPPAIVAIPVPDGLPGLGDGDAVTVRAAPPVTYRRC